MMKKAAGFLGSIALALISVFSFGTDAEAAAKPEVIISGYHLEENLEFETETTLHIDIANMSNVYEVEGVLITYTSANNTVIPALEKTNQVYVTSLAPNQTTGVDIPVVLINSDAGYGQVSFSIEYTVGDTNVFTNNSYIVFPLNNNGDIEIKNVNVATSANYGAKSLVGLNYTNVGSSIIRGVKLVISGDVENGRVETEIGDVTAGRSGYYESYVVYNNVGANRINVSLTYEDSDGQTFVTDGGEYTITVQEDINKSEASETTTETQEITETQPENQGGGMNISISLFVLAAVIVVVVVILATVQAIKKRK